MCKKIIFIIIPTVVFFIILEAAFATYFYILHDSFFTPKQLSTLLFQHKSHISSQECPYHEQLGPSPYVGYIYRSSKAGQCQTKVNNVGRSGPDYPATNDSNEYTIMVTGGSVAELSVLDGIKNNESYLERYLNQHYIPPQGQRFKVITSAMGDYRTPQNIISFMLYENIVDAVIDISGFNEALQYFQNARFEKGAESFWAQFELERLQALNKSKDKGFRLANFLSNSTCSLSYTCLFIGQRVMNILTVSNSYNEGRYKEQQKYDYFSDSRDVSKLDDIRLQRHRSYYKMFQTLCTGMNKKCSFFLQPVPLLQKELTKEEKAQLIPVREDFAQLYLNIVNSLVQLKKESNLSIYSLIDIFKETPERIYSDHIHFGNFNHGEISKGNLILWNRVIKAISVDWNLKRKNGH